MRGSIKTRLLALALGAVTLVWLGTAVFTYFEGREELDELLDAHLAQSATLLIAQVAHEIDELEEEHAPALHKYARRVVFQAWEEGRLRLRSANAPTEPLAGNAPGFSERTIDKHRWRVFTSRDAKGGFVIHVGERAELRAKLAREMALNLLKPLLYALPLLALLLWVAVGRGLRPLVALREQVARRARTTSRRWNWPKRPARSSRWSNSSTPCSGASPIRSKTNAVSPPTPPTNCARPWPRSGPRPRWRAASMTTIPGPMR